MSLGMPHGRRTPLLLLLLAAGALGYGFQSAKEAALVAERDDAIARVQRIVNQPVPALPRRPEVEVATFGPGGWFHAGAAKPDFLSVDVSRTQELPYEKFEYVTSDQNPGVMFRGRDLEFNGMTKYFYTDRSLPKKRLDPAEMAEINRLYRIIGAREQELARLRSEPSPSAGAVRIYVAAGAVLLMLALAFYLVRRSRRVHRDR